MKLKTIRTHIYILYGISIVLFAYIIYVHVKHIQLEEVVYEMFPFFRDVIDDIGDLWKAVFG